MAATVSIWHIDADLDVLYPNWSTNMPSLLTIRIDDKRCYATSLCIMRI